ncbi:Telomerase Cajal body protein 1 [Trichuris trichiura]|uniref:WD repeat-containing protein 79 n=1 Tax=Trichuris trichiura TaxID=36087 RepID=A0A077Z2E5_TRITR|nr:Telomerase Cajal body protein 1 [Trichuris trichiura]
MPHTKRKKARLLTPISCVLKDALASSATICGNEEALVQQVEQTAVPEPCVARARSVQDLVESDGTSPDTEEQTAPAVTGSQPYVGSVSFILNQLKTESVKFEHDEPISPVSNVLPMENASSPKEETVSTAFTTTLTTRRVPANSISFLLSQLKEGLQKVESSSVIETQVSGSAFSTSREYPESVAVSEELSVALANSSEAVRFPVNNWKLIGTLQLRVHKKQDNQLEEEFSLVKDYNWPPKLLQSIELEFHAAVPLFNNFLKMCKWSADGGNLITASEDRRVRLFRLVEKRKSKYSLCLNCRLPISDCIYDFCWSPSASVFAVACRNCPVNVYDKNGEKIAHYTPINCKDEMSRTISVAIDNVGSCLYAGCNKFVYQFDMSRPGRQTSIIPTWQKRAASQPGIISCFAFQKPSTSSFFAGSYSGWVALYDNRMVGSCMLFETNRNGITQIATTTCGRYLFTGGRMDDSIFCWDVRVMPKLVCTLRRPARTQQRISFEWTRGILVSGTSDGSVYLWTEPYLHSGTLEPISETCVSKSAINGVSLNLDYSLLATSSGERMSLRLVDDMLEKEAMVILKHGESDNALKLWSV